MKLNYYEETDSLYISEISSMTSSGSKEIADGLIVDFDEAGHVLGLDVQHASERIDLRSIESKQLPLNNQVA